MTGDETHAGAAARLVTEVTTETLQAFEGLMRPVDLVTGFAQVHATLAIASAVADLAAAVRERQESDDAHLANLVDAVHLLREQLAGDGEG